MNPYSYIAQFSLASTLAALALTGCGELAPDAASAASDPNATTVAPEAGTDAADPLAHFDSGGQPYCLVPGEAPIVCSSIYSDAPNRGHEYDVHLRDGDRVPCFLVFRCQGAAACIAADGRVGECVP
jgi:hypothetical protein